MQEMCGSDIGTRRACGNPSNSFQRIIYRNTIVIDFNKRGRGYPKITHCARSYTAPFTGGRLGSLKLSHAQHVSIRVVEPRHTSGTARDGPDLQFVLSEPFVKIECH